MITLLSPAQGESVSLLTETQKTFIADEAGRAAVPAGKIFQWDDLHRSGKADDSIPLPVIFRWTGGGEDAHLTVSAREDLSEPVAEVCGAGYAEVYNLMPGTVFYWQVRAGNVKSECRSFLIPDEEVRFLSIDGISNVRDLGSWRTEDGTGLKRGLLFRCGEFDSHSTVTDAGRETALRGLGIRTDLDLRGEGELHMHASPLSPEVRWVHIPFTCYTSVYEEPEFAQALPAVFEVLGDPDAYPLCFHCWGGADRGGTLSLLIEAVLGVPKEKLILDYELTSLSVWGIRTRNYAPFAAMMAHLEEFPGKTFADRVTAFLRSMGVTQTSIDGLKHMMCEKGSS